MQKYVSKKDIPNVVAMHAKRVDAGVRAHTQWLRADKDTLSLDTGDVLVLQMLILVVIENRIVDAVDRRCVCM